MVRQKTRGLIELDRYFQKHGITLEQVARATGYSRGHLKNLMNGSAVLNESARWRFEKAYPELPRDLLNGSDGE